MKTTITKEFIPIIDPGFLVEYLNLINNRLEDKYGPLSILIIELFSLIEKIKILYGIELKVEISKELHIQMLKEIIVRRNK